MRQQGRLTDWSDDRGYGFITPLSGGPTLFVHISEFPPSLRRPMVTDLITYDVESDDRGRLRACGVLFMTPAHARSSRTHDSARSSSVEVRPVPVNVLGVSMGFLVLVAALAALGLAPWAVPVAYLGVSAMTFLAYGMDKAAAEEHRWRTAESTLHLFAVVGGWPGALVAQRVFRHKTIKQPFQTIFWVTVLINLVLLVWFLVAAPLSAGPG